jgi:hypothetical protein
MKKPKEMATFYDTFLLKHTLNIFAYISSFKTWFVANILRFQKCFEVDVSDFQTEL